MITEFLQRYQNVGTLPVGLNNQINNIQNSKLNNMKRILASLMAIAMLSATVYAYNGNKQIKSKPECCSEGCCKNECTNMNSTTIYAAKRGLVIHKTGGGCNCPCC